MKPHKGRALDIFTEQSRDAGHTLEWQDLSSAHGFSLCLYVPMQDLSFRESTVLGADHIPRPRTVNLLQDIWLFSLQYVYFLALLCA